MGKDESMIAKTDQVISVNVENKETLSDTVLGINSLVEIGNGLWYDSSTRIVYWWNGILIKYGSDTVPTPYYAPNGMPYRYNPSTNTFEEINSYLSAQKCPEN